MHFTIAFFGFGPGSAVDSCDSLRPAGGLRPFAAYAVPRGRAVITSALGYAYRF